MDNRKRFGEFCADGDEKYEDVKVYLGVNAALASKDAPKWIEAMTKERAK